MLDEFLVRHRVFTYDSVCEVLHKESPRSRAAVDVFLKRLCSKGRIGRIRRELYFAIPPGETADSCQVDLGLAASLLAPDVVLSHITALEHHTGAAVGSGGRVCFTTTAKIRPTTFHGVRFCPNRPHVKLSRTGHHDIQVEIVDRQGELVRVTGPERSLVDTLNSIKLCGGLKAVRPLLEKAITLDGFNMDRCVEYLRRLDNPSATVRTGWFLQRHEAHLSSGPLDYDLIHEHRPAQLRYLIPGDRGGTLIPQWKLIVPREFEE